MVGRAKIAVIGAGNVGATCALWIVSQQLGDVVLVDIPQMEPATRGKALDLYECAPVRRFDCAVTGTADYADIAGADVVVLTAGVPRKPGMSRDDLVKTNVAIVRSVSEQIAAHAPDSIVIVVSNPLDAMVYTAWKVTGFPTGRIVGQAGCLDMARFKAFIAEETGFSVEDIGTLLLGGHGDDMVPLPRFTNISGIPVTEFMSRARLDELVERAKQGGGEIVELLGTSAYYAPAAAVTQMVEAIVRDKKRILPCAGYCAGQYGIEGLFVGVPCVLGAGGMERILEVRLERGEQELLTSSAAHVRELVEVVKRQYPELA
ncbi:MAG: malate dehydrogenase [Spirochaetaceae bacterium]|nr:malate dehydrogenase [Spirochaetaceae bacterium]